MKKITYRELCSNMYQFNRKNNNGSKDNSDKRLSGVIVFIKESFDKVYPLESRSYLVTNNNKAWIDGMCGYSIYGNSLDGTDIGVRLEQYMWAEHGGVNGWKIDYCYMLDETGEPV